MLSARLVRMIEDHAEELTRGVLTDLQSNPRTPAYHRLSPEELHLRVFDVYRNLGRWVSDKTESPVQAVYGELGKRRRAEGVPLSEVVYALILTKEHLRSYVRISGLVDSVVELYQEEELNLLIEHFFDKAIYLTVKGYEESTSTRPVSTSPAL